MVFFEPPPRTRGVYLHEVGPLLFRHRPQIHAKRLSSLTKFLCLLTPLAALVACEGSLGSQAPESSGDGDDPAVAAACADDKLGQQPLRRLSSLQYRNTLTALFGAELADLVTEGSIFPHTVIDQGFHGDAEANTVNTSESNAIEDNAERIANLILDDPDPFLQGLVPCDLSSTSSTEEIEGCLDPFLEDFALRAYRRPLTEEEAAIVRRVFDQVSTDQGGVAGFSAAVQLIVQSPALLYRVERGDGETSEGHVRLSSYEMAARLSYFLTDSMPDEELLDAAASNELRTVEQIRDHARRLSDTEAFNQTLRRFFEDWLHLYELEDAPKDPEIFPEFSARVRDELLEETSRLLESVLEQGDGSLRTLLGSTHA
jgi:hypothetical protein